MAKWAMQITPHDEWDYDATNEVILFENNNETFATQINKNGFIYTWQANNGTLLVAEKTHPFVNWASNIDLRTGVPDKTPAYNTHEEVTTRGICPSSYGAKSPAPAAFSPHTGLMYVPLNHICMTYNPVQSNYVAGQPWVGAILKLFPGPDEVLGGIAAYDPLINKAIWYNQEKYSVASGVLATGDLIFYGTLDSLFKAVNAKTGEELWNFPTLAPVIGNAFTYSHQGKQYIGTFSSPVQGWLNQSSPGNRRSFGISPKEYKSRSDLNSYRDNTDPNKGTLDIFSL
jgi:glucose dehydrogenase